MSDPWTNTHRTVGRAFTVALSTTVAAHRRIAALGGEDQPRDDHGRFGSGGIGKASKPKKSSKASAVKEQTPTPGAKAEIAAQPARKVDASMQRYAEEANESAAATRLGGVSLPDSEPMDVMVPAHDSQRAQWEKEANRYRDEKEGGNPRPTPMKLEGRIAHGVELKTMLTSKDDVVATNKYAKVRKLVWEKQTGATLHTVVVDDRKVFEAGGAGVHDESKRVYYYRRGCPDQRGIQATMHRCKDFSEVKSLMNMPEKQLPDDAKRTDGALRVGAWKPITDEKGKGFINRKTGEIARPKK